MQQPTDRLRYISITLASFWFCLKVKASSVIFIILDECQSLKFSFTIRWDWSGQCTFVLGFGLPTYSTRTAPFDLVAMGLIAPSMLTRMSLWFPYTVEPMCRSSRDTSYNYAQWVECSLCRLRKARFHYQNWNVTFNDGMDWYRRVNYICCID